MTSSGMTSSGGTSSGGKCAVLPSESEAPQHLQVMLLQNRRLCPQIEETDRSFARGDAHPLVQCGVLLHVEDIVRHLHPVASGGQQTGHSVGDRLGTAAGGKACQIGRAHV